MKFLSDHRLCWVVFLPVFFVMGLIAFPGFVDAQTQNEGIDRGLQDRTIDPAMSNKELRSADKSWDEVEDFVVFGDVQAFGTYSNLTGNEEWGGSFYGLVAPGYRLGNRLMLITMYDGQYDKRQELYSDNYGLRTRTEFQRHAFTPMLRIDFGEDARYSITPSLFYTATWNKDDGQGSSWDNGLYNYRDEGVGLDFDMRRVFGDPGEFKIGLQYYQRRYPNFTNLLYRWNGISLNPTNDYRDEKDYHGMMALLGYSWVVDSGFSWILEYSLLSKKFDEKIVHKSTGELHSSKKQQDYVHELGFDFWYTFDDIGGGLELGLDLLGRVYDSNEKFVHFDGLFSWDVNDDYFDYRSYRVKPNISYIFETIPLTVKASYSYEYIDYTDRWALDSTGGWAGKDEQWESLHQVVLGLKFDISEKMSVLAQWEHLKGRSNNDDEAVYMYDYRLNNLLLGFKYSF